MSSLQELNEAFKILNTYCIPTENKKRREKYTELQQKIELELTQQVQDTFKLVKMILKRAGHLLEKAKLQTNIQQLDKAKLIEDNETYGVLNV